MAGDGAATSSTSTPSSKLLSSTGTRRTGRYASGGASRSTLSASSTTSSTSNNNAITNAIINNNSNIDRRPLIIEFGGSAIVRVGHADQFQPQHLLPLPTPLFGTNNSQTNNNNHKTESEWYVTLSPIIELIYDCVMIKPSSRYVMCIISQTYIVPTNFHKAFQQHLWNRNVPAFVLLNTFQVGPSATVFGISRSFMVHVGQYETICGCHSDGLALPYTYQTVPVGYELILSTMAKSTTTTTSTTTSTSTLSLRTMSLSSLSSSSDGIDWLLTNIHNPNSILCAILLSLQDCPRDVRSHVVSNIMFYGDGITLLPDLPRIIIKRLQQILMEEEDEETPSLSSPSQSTTTTTTTDTVVLGTIPINVKQFKPLSSRIGLISCAPYRPDIVGWIGGSLYATTWMKYTNESPIPWIYNTNYH